MDRKYDVITLGEILLRLSTPINGRLAQGDTLMKHLGVKYRFRDRTTRLKDSNDL